MARGFITGQIFQHKHNKNMNEQEIKFKSLIESTYEYCKAELAKQEELMETITHDHVDFRVQTHMLGYHKGRTALLEHLKFAIQRAN
jgi:hypothetical protein